MRILQRKLLPIKDSTGRSLLERYSKGFTLIEVITAISIFVLIGGCAVKIFAQGITDFKRTVESTREEFYVDEAFRYIEEQCRSSTKSISLAGNTIVVERLCYDNPASKPVDYIKLEGYNLVIKYTTYGSDRATNNILKYVSEFTVTKADNLIYLRLKKDSEKVYEKCLGLSNLK